MLLVWVGTVKLYTSDNARTAGSAPQHGAASASSITSAADKNIWCHRRRGRRVHRPPYTRYTPCEPAQYSMASELRICGVGYTRAGLYKTKTEQICTGISREKSVLLINVFI